MKRKELVKKWAEEISGIKYLILFYIDLIRAVASIIIMPIEKLFILIYNKTEERQKNRAINYFIGNETDERGRNI